MDVSDGQSGTGWVYLGWASWAPWRTGQEVQRRRGGDDNSEAFWLNEAYGLLADPMYTGEIRVPALWDTLTRRILSNDHLEIMRLVSKHMGGTT